MFPIPQLGATRRRLVGQLLTESAVLALAGGGAGLALAYWLPPLLLSAVPESGLHLDASPDHRVLAYALLVSVATALAVGLLPALRATSLELTSALRGEAAGGGRRASASRLRDVVVGVQVTGSALLLAVAGLFVRALLHAQSVDPGFRVRDVTAISLDVERRGYDAPRAAAVYDALQERLATLPGVASVARAHHPPLTAIYTTDMNAVDGGRAGAAGAEPPTRGVNVTLNVVSGAYFTTIGIPLLRGRAFNDAEVRAAGAVGVRPAVVSEAMAAHFWPSEDALGRRFSSDKVTYQVVGIARDVRSSSLAGPDGPFAYLAARRDDPTGMQIVVRASDTRGALAAVMAAVPELVRELDPDFLATTTPLEESVKRVLQPARLASLLITLIGVLATALALVGVCGVISYGVSQRTREIGVRLALGAPARHAVTLVMRQGGRIVLVGGAAGLALRRRVAGHAGAALRGERARPDRLRRDGGRGGDGRAPRHVPPGAARHPHRPRGHASLRLSGSGARYGRRTACRPAAQPSRLAAGS